MTRALDQLADLVHRETGIRLAGHQHPFLQSALDRIEAGSDPAAFARGLADPRRGSRLLARLIEEVTVKETSFLRDHGQLASIDWPLLLSRAHARGDARVRVWTAACATGEEAYSLALLASEAFDADRPPVTILATDISPDALARARVGSYRSRSVRDLGPVMRTRHLRADGELLVVGERLRELVTFARHNLIRDPFPPLGEPPFDLILCRNVLIYFDSATVGRVLASLERALASTGTLVLGAADALCATAARMADAGALGGAPAASPSRPLRRPLGRLPVPVRAADPHDAADYFQRGLEALERDDPAAAVDSLRRALYVAPDFGLAAFKLGAAHEALGDRASARRAYNQALRALDPHERHEALLGQIDLADIATAARARLDVLAVGAAPGRVS
jgi:chemotaxis protein methyltransferase CheR